MPEQPSGRLERLLNSQYATWWYFSFFVLEWILIVPLDLFVGLLAYKKPNDLPFYTILGAIGSTIGAGVGYLIGAFAWDTVGQRIVNATVSPDHFAMLTDWYARFHGIVIYVTGLLPLPFKLFTISAGFCSLPLASFLFFIFLTRYTRYTLVALACRRWGYHIATFSFKSAAYFLLLVMLLLAGAVVLS